MGETLPDDSQPAPQDEDLCCALCGHNLSKEARDVQACPGCGQQFATADGQAVIPDDRDLYCLHCGYNLRGLSGDPRRCPECFHLNPIDALLVPAAEIKRQIREMETGPAMCVFSVLLAGFATIWLVTAGVVAFVFPFLPPGIAAWYWGVWAFGRSCQWKSGWKGALARFHFYALVMIGIGLGLWAVCFVKGSEALDAMEGDPLLILYALAAVGSLIVVGLVLYRPFRWMCRRATSDFEPLQRAVAIEIIRTRHRKLLARPR